MNAQDEALLQRHLDANQELQELWNKHLKYKKKLEKLERKPYLTAEEKLEKKHLQVQKLQGKTRMEAILEKYRKA